MDIKTLGGAGFASQRTATEDQTWDLSKYHGIELEIEKSDGKEYTFILKDTLLTKNPETGREQSTISYEWDFAMADSHSMFIPWNQFKPTYRGKPKEKAPELDTKNIKRFSIMMRRYVLCAVIDNSGSLIGFSFFGEQEGDFSLVIKSIKAVTLHNGITGDEQSVREHLNRLELLLTQHTQMFILVVSTLVNDPVWFPCFCIILVSLCIITYCGYLRT